MKTIEKIDNLAVQLTELYNGAKVLFLYLNGYKIKYQYKIYNSNEVCLIIPFNSKNRDEIKAKLKEAIKDFKSEEYDLKLEHNFNTNGAFRPVGQLELNLSIKESNKPKF